MATELAHSNQLFAIRFVDGNGSRVVFAEAPSLGDALREENLRKLGGSTETLKFVSPATGDFSVEGFEFSSTRVKFTAVSAKAKSVFGRICGSEAISFTTTRSNAQYALQRLSSEGLSEVRY